MRLGWIVSGSISGANSRAWHLHAPAPFGVAGPRRSSSAMVPASSARFWVSALTTMESAGTLQHQRRRRLRPVVAAAT